MRIERERRRVGLLAVALLGPAFLVLAVGPAAAGRLFLSFLDGSQEVPPVPSPGSGTAETYLAADQQTARIKVRVEGLENTIVAAHVHYGAPGTNGPMLFSLGAFTDSIAVDFGPIGPAALEALLAGNLYVNVHTDVYLDGEIRGQLDPTFSRSFLASLDGSAEVPPNGSGGTGSGDLTLWPDGSRLHLDLSVADLEGTITDAHIHRAAPGENGPVVFPIGVFDGRAVRDFAPAPVDVADLEAGLLYVNVHTDLYPGGEIRGQIAENTPTAVDPANGGSSAFDDDPAVHLVAEPNPFREGTVLHLIGPERGRTAFAVTIHDAQGRLVRALPARRGERFRWDGRDARGRTVPAGIYYARPVPGGGAIPLVVVR